MRLRLIGEELLLLNILGNIIESRKPTIVHRDHYLFTNANNPAV